MKIPQQRHDRFSLSRWFGAAWDAPICVPENHIATPVDLTCTRCDGEIDEDDQGVVLSSLAHELGRFSRAAWHLDCWFNEIGVAAAVRIAAQGPIALDDGVE